MNTDTSSKNIKLVYFGGEPLGVPVLEELEASNLLPSLVVASPDRPVGRKQTLTPPPVKVWAEERSIPVWQPEDFADQAAVREKLEGTDVFVVVAYNKILPTWLIELPPHKTVNVHPSLLPLLRGASPIRSAILNDMRDHVGVTVMQLDAKMDHGPIIDQMVMQIAPENWPIRGPELDTALAHMGGAMLAAVLPDWVAGNIEPQEQDHTEATYCGKFDKSDTELQINPHALPSGDIAYQVLLKIYAFMDAPGTWFMHDNTRVKVGDAELAADGSLIIHDVTPAGKKTIDWQTYLQSIS